MNMSEQPFSAVQPSKARQMLGFEVDLFLLHIEVKARFRSETGPTGMRMPRRQVTTI